MRTIKEKHDILSFKHDESAQLIHKKHKMLRQNITIEQRKVITNSINKSPKVSIFVMRFCKKLNSAHF